MAPTSSSSTTKMQMRDNRTRKPKRPSDILIATLCEKFSECCNYSIQSENDMPSQQDDILISALCEQFSECYSSGSDNGRMYSRNYVNYLTNLQKMQNGKFGPEVLLDSQKPCYQLRLNQQNLSVADEVSPLFPLTTFTNGAMFCWNDMPVLEKLIRPIVNLSWIQEGKFGFKPINPEVASPIPEMTDFVVDSSNSWKLDETEGSCDNPCPDHSELQNSLYLQLQQAVTKYEAEFNTVFERSMTMMVMNGSGGEQSEGQIADESLKQQQEDRGPDSGIDNYDEHDEDIGEDEEFKEYKDEEVDEQMEGEEEGQQQEAQDVPGPLVFAMSLLLCTGIVCKVLEAFALV